MTTQEVLEAIARERTRLDSAIDALGDRATTLAVTEEGWTAKDVLAHLVHWATQIALGLGATVEPPVYMMEERERRRAAGLSDAMPTGEESNALAVANFRETSLPDMRARFDALVDTIGERVGQRSDEQLAATDAVPWAGPRPLWQFIAGDTFVHWPHHSEAIERALRESSR